MSFTYEIIGVIAGIIILILLISLMCYAWKLTEEDIEQSNIECCLEEGEPVIETKSWFDWKKNGRKCVGEGVNDRTY
ncbi:hypothetical protein GQ568_03175 [Patescibacteria group bacterium]|nr:hypothetical protein [Patescibacteria group bacterium]